MPSATPCSPFSKSVPRDPRTPALGHFAQPTLANYDLASLVTGETYTYEVAANYGVADVSTAATFRIATVYRDFGKALMASTCVRNV